MATFSNKKYETDNGLVFRAKVEDLDGIDTITGAEAAGALSLGMTVRISKNAREAGIQPRHVVLGRFIGAGATGTTEPEIAGRALVDSAQSYRRLVVLTETHYDTLEEEDTVVIEGTTYRIVSKQQERVK